MILNDAFISLVEYECNPPQPDKLLCRARIQGDIEKVFPDAQVYHTPGADYSFRAVVTRTEAGAAMVARIDGIDYRNFKNSVRDNARHDVYEDCWRILHAYQSRKGVPKPVKSAFASEEDYWDFDTYTRGEELHETGNDQPTIQGCSDTAEVARKPASAKAWAVRQKRDGGRISTWGTIVKPGKRDAKAR